MPPRAELSNIAVSGRLKLVPADENEISNVPAVASKHKGFAPGHKRFGGRKKREKVHPNDDAKMVAQKLGFSCLETVIQVVTTGLLPTTDGHARMVDVRERCRLLRELSALLYPRPAAIEITGKDGGPITHATLDLVALMKDPDLAHAAETLSLAIVKSDHPFPVVCANGDIRRPSN